MAGPKCRGTNRAGEPCKLPPMKGGVVCASHGGKAPQTRRKAELRLVEEKALKAVSAMGSWSPVTDPLSALADVAGEVTAVKDFLRGLVDGIVERQNRAEAAGPGGAALVGSSLGDTSLRTLDDKSAEQMRAEFTAYMAMLKMCVDTLGSIAKLNIDERMARIDEARAAMIGEALRRAFAEAGLSGEAHTRGMASFARHLRVVGSEERRTR